MAKLTRRFKPVTELEAGETTEVGVARLERDERAGLADLRLRLAEAKQLMAAIQAEIVPTQVTAPASIAAHAWFARASWPARDTTARRSARCSVTCHSGSGVCSPVPARTWPKQGASPPSAFEAAVAPELAYVTARYAALAPFGKVADLLSELRPISGAQNPGTMRNRTMRAGEAVVRPHVANTAEPAAAQPARPVVVGLDGGYVRGRHRQEERHFEVIAGKVIDAQGGRSRFAFTRNSPTIASDAFRQALAVAGVTARTPATVLSDGDAGLWRLQRESLPNATVVLDWWHAAVRFEHALQAARGLGATDAHQAAEAVRGPERAKWRLWHGRWPGCRRKLAALCRWVRTHVRDVAGIGRLEHHAIELLAYLERNQGALVHYTAGVGMANRSQPPSWKARSTRSSPNA